ncbi:MAG TPA: DUF2071 domain-containing protein [Candidatus Dormibacteraeota bacterium]|nr:DUF2071 domain-containing protein [Candidatus Dormibacteraeota bacterium]
MSHPLKKQDHRPWPLPRRPWIMAQVWHDLLFAHWPLGPEILRPLVPPGLALDTWNGQAWLAVVPFRMTGVRLRATPAIPWFSAFPELNVRTYVTHGGKPGVWFFSLDATNSGAVAGARLWFHLPYFRAEMGLVQEEGWIFYHSRRTHRGCPGAELQARYRPTGPAYTAEAGTLDHWLTERYCLYSADCWQRIYRAGIHHWPWPLQPAEAEFAMHTMTAPLGFALPQSPSLLHFARVQDVRVWAPFSNHIIT